MTDIVQIAQNSLQEKRRITARQHYYKNKDECNFTRLKNQHRVDLGREFVDDIYIKFNNDMVQIKPVIAYYRKKQKCIQLFAQYETAGETCVF